MAKFLDIQQDAIKRYGVTLCYGELCKDDWQRTHVHIREKKICKWYPKNSIQSTITLLHKTTRRKPPRFRGNVAKSANSFVRNAQLADRRNN